MDPMGPWPGGQDTRLFQLCGGQCHSECTKAADSFRAGNGLTEAREVFKKTLAGRTIRSDRLWARGEPRGPDSWPKVWFGTAGMCCVETADMCRPETADVSS